MVETPDGTVARRDFSLSIVPTHGGEITLPEISVEWLDTGTGEAQIATLAAQTISVEGTMPTPVAAVPDQPAAAPAVSAQNAWVTPCLFGAAGLLGAFGLGLVVSRCKHGGSEPDREPQKGDTLRKLRIAAKANDRKTFYAGLLELRTQATPAERDPIDAGLLTLDQATYAPAMAKEDVDLNKMLKDVSRGAATESKFWRQSKGDNLPALYPQTQS